VGNKTLYRLSHSVEEKCFGARFVRVAVGECDELLALGYGDGRKETWEDDAERRAQPHIKEIG
jgi:hypothetical protein